MPLHDHTAYPYVVSTPPAAGTRFVSNTDARAFLRLEVVDIDDAELEAFIDAAQAATERFTRLTLFTTEFATTRDFFGPPFELKRAPLIATVSITRLVLNVATAVTATVFKDINVGVLNYGSIVLKADQIWPSDQDHEERTIEIKFNAGFGAASTDLPPDLIQGMLRVLADMVENRGDCDAQGATISNGGKALLRRFRIMDV